MEKWFVVNKGADFKKIAKKFQISPITARLIRNREVIGDEAIEKYLNGGKESLYDPHLLKDAGLLTDILSQKICDKKAIQIIGDYDIDGVMATYILYCGLKRCGANVSYQIPDRIKDGYGMNDHLIEKAYQEGTDTVITCDNGIAAIEEIAHAKKLGMTVLVTDHHEVPFLEEDGQKKFLYSQADAVVNPRQETCTYPFKGLCGAAVAFKVVQVLYEKQQIPAAEAYEFLEYVAFATVGDVMDLTDENRILVREGLKQIRHTGNIGLRALIQKNKLDPARISAYHFGFVLGPCINASGRLETAKVALSLFLQESETDASQIAEKLVELNDQRKSMTAQGVEEAVHTVEAGGAGEKVFVIFLPDVHESLAGIIAGRIREIYNRPVFILTKAEEGIKGSGRSVEGYSMYEELCKCRELFTRFGGHPMAAGISMEESLADIFRQRINACCELTEEDFISKIKIDIPMPAGYPTTELVKELERLEPFGKGNPKPQFADKNLGIAGARIVGKNQNVLKLNLVTEYGEQIPAVYFGDIEIWKSYYAQKFGEDELAKAFRRQKNSIRMSIVYYPEVNEYQGVSNVQLIIRNYQ